MELLNSTKPWQRLRKLISFPTTAFLKIKVRSELQRIRWCDPSCGAGPRLHTELGSIVVRQGKPTNGLQGEFKVTASVGLLHTKWEVQPGHAMHKL